MKKDIQLNLSEFECGQMLDGLWERENAWRQTAMVLRGEMSDDEFLCEDCSDAEEAEAIYRDYKELTSKINDQMKSQVADE
jgi:hypothetical protein